MLKAIFVLSLIIPSSSESSSVVLSTSFYYYFIFIFMTSFCFLSAFPGDTMFLFLTFMFPTQRKETFALQNTPHKNHLEDLTIAINKQV